MQLQGLWLVLAGFVLGFAVSTLWEWLYYRRQRWLQLEALPPPLAPSYEEETHAFAEEEVALASPDNRLTPAYRSPGIYLESEQAGPRAVHLETGSDIPARTLQWQDEPTPPLPPVTTPPDRSVARGPTDGASGPALEAPVPVAERDTLPLPAALSSRSPQLDSVASTDIELVLPVVSSALTLPPDDESAPSAALPAVAALLPPATVVSDDYLELDPLDLPVVLAPVPIVPLETSSPSELRHIPESRATPEREQWSPGQNARMLPAQVTLPLLPVTEPAAELPPPLPALPFYRGFGVRSNNYPDDLSQIRGIGEIYKQRLYAAGIYTWQQVADSDLDTLRHITRAKPNADLADWQTQARSLVKRFNRSGARYQGPPPDDLTSIEGIGPTVRDALYRAGIATFAQLAQTTPTTLAEILPAPTIGMTYHFADWIEQASRRAPPQV